MTLSEFIALRVGGHPVGVLEVPRRQVKSILLAKRLPNNQADQATVGQRRLSNAANREKHKTR